MEEIWKNIKDYEGYYQISSFGRIKNNDNYILTNWLNKNGYFMCDLYNNKVKKHKLVHRLVAIAFISNDFNKNNVNHIDGNKQNNKISNLEWCTTSENGLHAYKNGLSLPTKISKVDQYSKDGCYMRSWNMIKEASKKLKINERNISACCRNLRPTAGGYRWKYNQL